MNVRFEPDERLAQVSNMPAAIFVVDDKVNEATRQYFVGVLSLVGSINQSAVSLRMRNVTLCTIVDNDRKYVYINAMMLIVTKHAIIFFSNPDWL